MNNAVSNGNVIEYTNVTGTKINSGDVVPVGKFCGVAVSDIPDGATGAVSVEGVFDLVKKTASEVIAAGDAIAYDSGIVKVDGSVGIAIGKDIFVGYAVLPSTAGEPIVRVKLAK